MPVSKLQNTTVSYTHLDVYKRQTLKEREMPYYLPPERAGECVPEADLLVIYRGDDFE